MYFFFSIIKHEHTSFLKFVGFKKRVMYLLRHKRDLSSALVSTYMNESFWNVKHHFLKNGFWDTSFMYKEEFNNYVDLLRLPNVANLPLDYNGDRCS